MPHVEYVVFTNSPPVSLLICRVLATHTATTMQSGGC